MFYTACAIHCNQCEKLQLLFQINPIPFWKRPILVNEDVKCPDDFQALKTEIVVFKNNMNVITNNIYNSDACRIDEINKQT